MSLAPLPSGPLLFFDGTCRLCQEAAQALVQRSPSLWVATLQGPYGEALRLAKGWPSGEWSSLIFMHPSPEPLACRGLAFKTDGLVEALRTCRGPLGWVAPLVAMAPRAGRDRVYRFIAERRYRWWGERQCPPAQAPCWRGRLLG